MVIKARDTINVRTWEPPVLSPAQQAMATGHAATEDMYGKHVTTCKRCREGMDCRTERSLYAQAESTERRAIAAGVPL
jgi:hypothetical protein